MSHVSREVIRTLLDDFSQDELDATMQLFMAKSADELATTMADFINRQPQEAITYSLLASAIDVMTQQLKKRIEELSNETYRKRAKAARNN